MDSSGMKSHAFPTHPSPSLSHSSGQGLRTSLAMEESEGFRRDVPTAQEISSERTRRRRRHEEEETRRQYQEKRSSGEGFTEEKGWFRRREKSGSRELERGVDHASERSRWFRRREKTSPKEEKLILRQGSDKNKDKTTTTATSTTTTTTIRSDSTRSKEVMNTQELTTDLATDRRNRTLQEQEKLKVPEPSVRRLSSPEIDTFGVITASLKIHVPLQQQSTIAFSKESDTTYVEETNLSEEAKLRLKDGTVSVSSRQRTGSNDSFLGQPITGSMSFQPLCKKDGDKQSYDSVLSSSSIGVYTMSPSERNTPSSDFHCASGTSSPMSAGALSPPLWLSPDSGTPGLSPPSSPPPQRRRSRKVDESGPKPVPLAHSATHTFGSKPIAPLRVREKSRVQPAPIGRSRTTDSMKVEETLDHKVIETRTRIDGSRSRNNTEKETNKKYTRKRYSAERHHTGHLPEIPSHNVRASTTESTTQLWKRWEIIASDPTEPETFV
ncbi:hypothetical protein Avbf_01193 [Armadillidium vulgare]|nr:hypothetical protein Avbf_01193 [Armadillidium vulgare]